VFASCSTDKTIAVFDTRDRSKAQLQVRAIWGGHVLDTCAAGGSIHSKGRWCAVGRGVQP
jgi:hypothetical protein